MLLILIIVGANVNCDKVCICYFSPCFKILVFEVSDNVKFSTKEEQLRDLRNDLFFQALFPEKSLYEFWVSVYKSYSMICAKAIKIMLPFPSLWLCGYGFSALTEI